MFDGTLITDQPLDYESYAPLWVSVLSVVAPSLPALCEPGITARVAAAILG